MQGLTPSQPVVATPAGVELDPLARLLGEVQLAPPCWIGPGCVLQGPLAAGRGLKAHGGAFLGGPAQHRLGGEGRLEIGEGVQIWEGATLHRGSRAGTGVTRIGDRVLVMAYAHVGHDAVVESDAVLSNGVQLGGHVHVSQQAVLGARVAIHQFVRIGRGAMVAAGAMVSHDVPPWSLVAGDRACVLGPNRAALPNAATRRAVATALRAFCPPRSKPDDLPDELLAFPEVQEILRFVDTRSGRALCRRGPRS